MSRQYKELDRAIFDNMYETTIIPPGAEEKLADVYEQIRCRCADMEKEQSKEEQIIEEQRKKEQINREQIKRMQTENRGGKSSNLPI